ncbi:high-affinity branched-chain amino acid ABC transporter permease LivM [Parvibaculum sp.]|uniref:high-affinity branched-chain amino acid ABC transporter permease LivM n=1 Tax=Parvibaculum sp. TaxID=2024848 RepID=UPI002BDA3C16|nr:high-affinity branched-chain amino acid ABC transporter permease LivM [Parvibaculum sp.]HUD53540.1 high-affinity branched-chain amino acid ABC transporter permease LivM [Parvibaculum sp.]
MESDVPKFSIGALLRDAGAAALVAALLAFPLLGFRLVDSARGLTLDTRLLWVVYAGAAVFAGRIVFSLVRISLASRTASAAKPAKPAVPGRARFLFGIALVAAALLLPWLPFADRNIIDKATLILIYVMLGWGLNIVVGLAGLLDLGYVAFYAVGAYSYALLSQNFGLSFWICLPLAGLLAASFGVALGFPVLRLRGDYLAIVTLGFGEIVREVLINWGKVTGGPNGIAGIQRPSFFGLPMVPSLPDGGTTFAQFFGLAFSPNHRIVFLYYLILALALATNLFTLRIRRLPIGRAWEALREDEIACRSLGLNPTTVKLSAFAIGAAFAGFAGSFFATRQGFISPESFTFIESAIILAIVVLGGMGSQIGIVLAAFLLVGLPEWFRELEQFRMVAFGAAMVLIMLWRPQGLLSHRDPTLRLGEFGAVRAKEVGA